MAKYKALLLNMRFTAIAVLCMAVIAVGAWTSKRIAGGNTKQSKEKKLERGNLIYASDPIEVSDIKVSNKSVKLNEKFEADDDWLKGATLKLKNISGKEIVHVQLDFEFPETELNGAVMAYQMMLGRRPGSANTSGVALSLAPGEKMTIAVDEEVYAKLAALVSHRQAIQNINKVKVRVAFVAFADGTGYGTGGTFYRQDPANPNRYLPVPTNAPPSS
jgi:hypothetical protein